MVVAQELGRSGREQELGEKPGVKPRLLLPCKPLVDASQRSVPLLCSTELWMECAEPKGGGSSGWGLSAFVYFA